MAKPVEEGDIVLAGPNGKIHWTVDKIESRIDPLGVWIRSGMTERRMRESYSQLRHYNEGSEK